MLAAALHLALLAVLPARRARLAPAQPFDIAFVHEVLPRPPPREPPPPSAKTPPPALALRAHAKPPAVPRAEPAPPEPAPPGEPPPAPAAPGEAPAAPGEADLFAPSALGTVVGPPPKADWGGHTRRAGDGQPAPAPADDRARIGKRVRGWMFDALAEHRAQSGDVAPHWRDIERGIEARFHPTREQVTSRSSLALMGRELVGGFARPVDPTRGPVLPPGGDLALWEEANAKINIAHEHFSQPNDWKRVVVDVELDGDGRVLAVRVVGSSGRRALDAAALEAVRGAAAAAAGPDRRRGPTVARFYVDASAAVELPALTPVVDPTSGRITGTTLQLFLMHFDEVSGKVDVKYAGKQDVRTRVTLHAVRPASENESAER